MSEMNSPSETWVPTLDEVIASPRATSWGDTIALWPDRRPPVSKQACVDALDQAGPDRSEVMFALPCLSDDGIPCPEASECLTAKRKEITPLMYDREFLTRPRSSSTALFSLDRFRELELIREDLAFVRSFQPEHRRRYWVSNGWDIAWSERSGGDWFAKVTTVHDFKTRKRRVLDIHRWQGLTFRRQIELIRAHAAMYSADITVIEEAGAQTVWIQETNAADQRPDPSEQAGIGEEFEKALADLKVVGHGTGKKQDFEKGVPGMLLDIERKVWEFPYMTGSYNHEEAQTFFSEIEAFGWNDDKLEGVGEHDDTVMAWWHSWWGLEQGMKSRATVSSAAAIESAGQINRLRRR